LSHFYSSSQCVPTAGRMWPTTVFSVTRGSIQEKSSNVKYVDKRMRLHLPHWIACAG